MRPDISNIRTVLSNGGVAILPTETVYGIAARADNTAAIDRIYSVKGRGFDKPLAVCVRDSAQAQALAVFSPLAKALAAKFWEGPLTLVLPARRQTLDPRCYQGATIALRCPDIDWRGAFADTPLALTSANRSGEPAATTADTDLDVDAVLDGGPSREAMASTILAVEGDKITVLREGALTAKHLAAFDISWPS